MKTTVNNVNPISNQCFICNICNNRKPSKTELVEYLRAVYMQGLVLRSRRPSGYLD
jgi:hypothetical protein